MHGSITTCKGKHTTGHTDEKGYTIGVEISTIGKVLEDRLCRFVVGHICHGDEHTKVSQNVNHENEGFQARQELSSNNVHNKSYDHNRPHQKGTLVGLRAEAVPTQDNGTQNLSSSHVG